MNKAQRKEPRGGNMVELQAGGLGHFKVKKVIFFHHIIINIQERGDVSLVHTNKMSRRTPQSDFL
jgi:hypothetical protein